MTDVWLLVFTPTLLIITAIAIIKGRSSSRSYWLAWCGLASTLLGDYFLAMRDSPLHSNGFLYGVAGFSLAHIFWIIFLSRHSKLNMRVAAALFFSLACLFIARLIPALNSGILTSALVIYTLLSVTSVSYAYGTHTLSSAWKYGLSMLLFSDTMIAFGAILKVPHVGNLIVATYLTSLLCIATAITRCRNKPNSYSRIRNIKRVPSAVFWGGAITFILFLIAMLIYPGETYNPCRRMLSRLGRTQINGTAFPMCHYLFTSSLILSALVVAWFYPALSCFVKGARKKKIFLWAGTLNAAGLLTIAFVPENVNGLFHNAGCFAAVGGGVIALLILTPGKNNPRVPRHIRLGWLTWCCILVAIFQALLLLHRFKVLPFSPYVPTCQKLLILTFMLWIEYYALLLFKRTRMRSARK